MEYATSYANALKSVNSELKRLKDEAKRLKVEKVNTERRLYRWLKANNETSFEGFTLEKLKPKAPVKRKKKADKINDGIALLREIGVPDPETFYEEFLKTQKVS